MGEFPGGAHAAPSAVDEPDRHLGGYITEHYKPCVIVINKWDLVMERASSEDYGKYLIETMPGLGYAPVAFTTAKTTKNVQSVLNLASSLYKQARTRVTTADLNQVLEAATQTNTPRPHHGTGDVKLLYATQVAVCPPTIVLFVNNPDNFGEDYRRFIVNRFREELPFPEVPIRLILRAHFEENEKKPKQKRRRN